MYNIEPTKVLERRLNKMRRVLDKLYNNNNEIERVAPLSVRGQDTI